MSQFGECVLNRRIPNGTYGGVGGRGLTAPSYPIYCFVIPEEHCGYRQAINREKRGFGTFVPGQSPGEYKGKKRETRFELATSALGRRHSTTELLPQEASRYRLYHTSLKDFYPLHPLKLPDVIRQQYQVVMEAGRGDQEVEITDEASFLS